MRVLVTRAADDAARTAVALSRLGHEAISAPVVTIIARHVALPKGRPAALVVTSHHAFAAEIRAAFDRTMPVFAVGSRTAEAARAAGFKDVRIGSGGGADLAPLVALTLPRPGPLLYLAGRDRKPGLEAALADAGFRVEAVEAYAAEPAQAWPAAAVETLRRRDVEVALHYSRRSAELALALARRHGLFDALLLLRNVCLSADAAEPLTHAGASSVATAERPDEERLLALLMSR